MYCFAEDRLGRKTCCSTKIDRRREKNEKKKCRKTNTYKVTDEYTTRAYTQRGNVNKIGYYYNV